MKLICWLLLLVCPYIGISKGFDTVTPLSVGDHTPDITFTMYNYSYPSASLSTFKGKIILLDFWATWCSVCVKKIPLLDSLQRVHTNDLQVILVSALNTGDTKEKAGRFLHNISLPVALKDTVADRLFAHKLLPHYVWLDRNMKIIGITGGEEVTAANIEAVIHGKRVSFPVKEDITGFDRQKPLFVNGNGGNGAGLEFRSTLSAHISGLPSGSHINRDSKGLVTGVIITNTSRFYLLEEAYRRYMPLNRVHLAVNDSTLLPGTKDPFDNYCYELITPACTWEKACAYMRQDLERYFGLGIRIEKLLTACYVLSADTSLLYTYKSRGGKPESFLYEPAHRYLVNRPFSIRGHYLDETLDLPVADESGININVDIDLGKTDLKNISALQEALSRYGITLVRSERMLDNLIIYQKQQP